LRLFVFASTPAHNGQNVSVVPIREKDVLLSGRCGAQEVVYGRKNPLGGHVTDIIVYGPKGISIDELMVYAPKPGDVYSPVRFNEWIAAVNKKYAGDSGPLKSAKWGARMDHARARVTI